MGATAPTVQSVREEHEQFLPFLEEIRRVADSIGRVSTKSLLGRVDEIHGFLAHRLIPHAVAEGRLMLPLVRKLPAGGEAALGMNQCHVQVGRLTDELEAARGRAESAGLDTELESELRRILYGAHALLTAHFAQFEDVFAAIEAARSPSERADLFEAVERSAQEVSDQYE
ncbi:MAG TPA: hemerythrin domain-containing protein [Actinomycetota bacterium]